MDITFMKTTDDPRKLIKTFENIYTTTPATTPISNTEATMSLLRPVFLVAYNSLILTATHISVPDWGNRIYAINNIEFQTGGKLSVSCTIDVLATYGAAIADCTCSVSRSESAGINWVPDDKFPLDTNHTITKGESSVFSSPFIKDSTAPWVLTVINDIGAVHTTQQRKKVE